jgi:hypothetical protein
MTKQLIFLCIVFSFFVSCKNSEEEENKQKVKRETNIVNLLHEDRIFSKLCDSVGMKTAFIDYLDSNGTILKPNQLPIEGANAIDYLIQQNDNEYKLTWEPKFADLSEDGTIGYTYGIYAIHPVQIDTIIFGTYINVWKKQNNKWKLMLHSGNEGIGEKN